MNLKVNDMADSPQAEQSLDALAESLLAPTKPEPPKRTRPPVEGKAPTPAAAKPEISEPVEAPDADDEPDRDEDARDFMDDLMGGTDAKAEDDPDNDPAGEDDDPDDDARVYRVKRNGKVEEVSLADLKKSWNGSKAIDARVQEAAEDRNAAKAEREAVTQLAAQSRALHERLAYVYQNYNAVMFAPRVNRPDPSMQQVDPIGYFNQMEAFRDDQARIQQEQGQMQQTLQMASEQFQEHRREMLGREAQALHAKMPGLKNRENAAEFKRRIADIGAAHGFSPEEIAMADDHRLLTMAAEAAAYREMKARMSGKKARPTTEVKRRPMPARGDNRPQGETSRKAARNRKVMAKARETGNLDDIALTLLI